jgi:hypothetical protein
VIPHHRYPNPGYIGSSSGFAILNEVQSMSATPVEAEVQSPYDQSDAQEDTFEDHGVLPRAQHILQRLGNVEELSKLILAWLDTGANLALAEPFVLGCVHAMLAYPWKRASAYLEPGSGEQSRQYSQQAKLLSRNTRKVIALAEHNTFESYISQMSGLNIRWERVYIMRIRNE